MSVDLGAVINLSQDLRPKVEKILQEAAKDLALQAHAHILEQVQEKLHSTREKYVAALGFKQVDSNTWVISLDQKAMWIEEGKPEGEMIDDLLKSRKTKTAEDGSRYLSVPFQHKKGPTSSTPAQQDLTATVRAELARRKIPYAKIENDAQGAPKTGLLHSFDINRLPIKTGEGPGMGQGPIGAVRQGPTGIPYLQGVRIYQKQVENKRTGKLQTVRDIMTFRVVSSKMKGSGRWVHPGIDAYHFFESAEKWTLDQWPKIRDQILTQVVGTL